MRPVLHIDLSHCALANTSPASEHKSRQPLLLVAMLSFPKNLGTKSLVRALLQGSFPGGESFLEEA